MNARFKVYVHGSPVTLTLQPHKPIAHMTGGPTDEGYEWHRTIYEFDGDYVTATHDYESRCCDGRFSSNNEMRCPVGLLKASKRRSPMWEGVSSGQRDYNAEAAGY